MTRVDSANYKMPVLGFQLAFDNTGRVYRGGSWNYAALIARAASRIRSSPGYRHDRVGLRLVRDGEGK